MRARAPWVMLAVLAVLLLSRGLGHIGPEWFRLTAAWCALVVIPAVLLAVPRGALGFVDALAIGTGESLALFSLLALAVHLAGGGLGLLLALHPVAVAITAAIVLRSRPAEETGRPKQRARLATTLAAVTLGGLVALGLVRAQPVDYRMDVYDHVGAGARVEHRDRVFSREIGNGDEGARPDPRKGTWNTMLAGVNRLSGADPLSTWHAATVLGTLIGVLAFIRLARVFQGAAWPIGALLLVLAHEGGPAGAWFSRSAYPGVIGLFLFALVLAESLHAVRGGRRFPVMLAAALPLVHLMAGLLGAIALALLALLCLAPATGMSHGRPGLVVSIVIVAAIGLWRAISAGPATNPVQFEIQGVLFLTDRWFMPEPRTFFERLGVFGLLGLVVSPLLWIHRGQPGEAWLLSLVGVFFILSLPPVATLIGTHLSYLLRRVPALVPFPLVVGLFLEHLVRRFRSGQGARRLVPAVLGMLLVIVPLGRLGQAVALAAGSTAHATARGAWVGDLVEVVEGLPPSARVATDPITSYALYAHTLARPLVLPDQHSSPNDDGAVTRLKDLARILSPWTPERIRADLLARHDVTHIVVNEEPSRVVVTFGYPVHPENTALLDDHLAAAGESYRLLRSSGAVRLYEIDPEPGRQLRSNGDGQGAAPRNPYTTSEPPPAVSEMTDSGLSLTSVRLVGRDFSPGDVVSVECSLFRSAAEPTIGDYYAFLALTSATRPTGRFAKVRSRVSRSLGDAPDRAVVHRNVAQGRYPVILWSENEMVNDRYAIRIPLDLSPGRYRVTMNIVRRPYYQNRRLAWLLGDGDEYSRIPVGEIRIFGPGGGA